MENPCIHHIASLLTATRFVVRGDSMESALSDGHYILVKRRAYRLAQPVRGDIVLFTHPAGDLRYLVKRIVGMPGEHIQIAGKRVLINDETLVETYASEVTLLESPFPSQWHLDDQQYFVMGDYRSDSYDSRRFGPIEQRHIIGKAWLRYWPPTAWGGI